MGGGGGGGSTFERSSPAKLQREIREAELEAADAEFGPKLAELLDGYLAVVNDRNAREVQARLDEIKDTLAPVIEGTLDLRFGGSVAKHTYVDGLSDVDALVVVKPDSTGPELSPIALRKKLADALRQSLGDKAAVREGDLAVTLMSRTGPEIQLVPALRTGQHLAVPSRHGDWSKINPEKFAAGLTKRNQECGGKVVPVIKLAKSINNTLPERLQLSGYHIESLAIAAFRNYAGPKTTSRMLRHLFGRIPDLLRSPIRDRTGQSVHVDEYLGRAGSPQRQQASHLFERLAKRMENATAARSLDAWKRLIDE